MNKYLSFLALLILPVMTIQAQESISLDQCRQWAKEQYPSSRQKGLLDESYELKMKNLGTSWYPQLYLNAQASWQSDVTQVDIPLPMVSLPEIKKDMYRISLDLNQQIWDGGLTSRQKQLEQAGLKVEQQNLEVELNKISERINQLYFSILLFRENTALLENVKQELKSKLKKAEAGVKNEAALPVSVDILNAEILKVEQQLMEVKSSELAALNMLGEWINKPLSQETQLATPENSTSYTLENTRPELELFDLQIERTEAVKNLAGVKRYPRISLYGQAGYGRPGMNMLNPDFSDFYTAGLRISWNIWNWNQTANEKKIAGLQQDIIITQKESFEKNTRVILQKDVVEIMKYDELMEKDKEIVALRDRIAENYSIQFDNGIITATEYTTELNAAAQARMNMKLHELQKKMSIENYLFNAGKQ